MVPSARPMDANGSTPTDARGASGGAEARDLLAIFAVSAAIMLDQLTRTRVLSGVVWYRFAFLTISLVMLGLGAPGVWFALSMEYGYTVAGIANALLYGLAGVCLAGERS